MVAPIWPALAFLISVTFGTYIILVMLRFLLQLTQVTIRHDQVVRFLWKITDPPLIILYNFIPGWKNIDFAAGLLMVMLEMVELTLTNWLYGQPQIALLGLFLIALANLFILIFNIYTFTIIIQSILSWIMPYDLYRTPLGSLLYYFNEPLLRFARRRIPPVSGIDISPWIIVVILQILSILLGETLRGLAY